MTIKQNDKHILSTYDIGTKVQKALVLVYSEQTNCKKVHINVHKHAKPVWFSIRKKIRHCLNVLILYKSEFHGERQ